MRQQFNLLYDGPGVSGRTTNLFYIHYHASPEIRSELVSLQREEDRTVSFNLIVPNVRIREGAELQIHLYCSPGAVYKPRSRFRDLSEADAFVFVADSQSERLEADKYILNDIEENLQKQGKELATFPWVIQYNKRDLQNIAAVSDLQHELNRYNVPHFEAVATQGIGVFETFYAVMRRMLPDLASEITIPTINRVF